MRLVLLLPLVACTLARADVSVASSPTFVVHYSSHRLVIETARGRFVDDFGNQLLDDEPSRERSLVGPMSARVDDGVLRVQGRHAIWKRDYEGGTLLPTYSCEELLVACVIAADGEPRCTAPLLVGDESACNEADAPRGGDWSARHWDWHISPKVAASDRAVRIDCGRRRTANQCRIKIATPLSRDP